MVPTIDSLVLRRAGVATLVVGLLGTIIGTILQGSKGLIDGYLVKIGVLLVLLLVLQDATFFAPKVFAAVIVSCTLAWTFVEVWVFSRTKVLYVDPVGTEGPK